MVTRTATVVPLVRSSSHLFHHSWRHSLRVLSRAVLRTSHFELRTELLLTLIAMALIILAQTAHAESFEVCTGTNAAWNCLAQNETTPSAAAAMPPASSTSPIEPPKPLENDFIVTSTFGTKATSGTAGCKTAALAENMVRALKVECNTWIKERKAELRMSEKITWTI